ncbi:MAG: urea amidolyase, partial [Pseudomonadota bacterium]
LPRAAQAAPGAALRFRFVEAEAALTLHRRWRRELALLPARCAPVIRDPGDMADLLTAQLISGVTDGEELS